MFIVQFLQWIAVAVLHHLALLSTLGWIATGAAISASNTAKTRSLAAAHAALVSAVTTTNLNLATTNNNLSATNTNLAATTTTANSTQSTVSSMQSSRGSVGTFTNSSNDLNTLETGTQQVSGANHFHFTQVAGDFDTLVASYGTTVNQCNALLAACRAAGIA